MDLTVIIVNYNVKYFLEQCLLSVKEALTGIKGEVIIADNNSVDGSCQMVKEKFPDYHLIENQKNLGFAKANNHALKIAKGKFILILNPDTVVEESTFLKCIDFMDQHPDAGAMGVKMIDGNGKFLPESKRSLPTPGVAFFKIFGLSRLFPHSHIFNKYHLGFLDPDKIHSVDILTGAFMFLRKKVIDQTGFFDEDYFMYGEDIDLSYRIISKGFHNYYYPDTRIIHYKGESTRKGSLNYVNLFYKAMIIFARKHYSRKNLRLLSFLISIAIYFRASLSVLKRVFLSTILPVLDILVIYSGYIILTPAWGKIKFGDPEHYPHLFIQLIVPSYIVIWIICGIFFSTYSRPIRLIKQVKGITTGSLIILLIYALLPNELRFSRALILLGTIWTMGSTILNRLVLHFLPGSHFKLYYYRKKKILIAGHPEETKRIETLLNQIGIVPEFIRTIAPVNEKSKDPNSGDISKIEEIVNYYKINELIFCSQDINIKEIISCMIKLEDHSMEFKIAPPESLSLIGSSSRNLQGDLHFYEINSIGKKTNRYKKRALDILLSILFLGLFPLLCVIVKNPWNFLNNILRVFLGKLSWVGYHNYSNSLPEIRNGVLSTVILTKSNQLTDKDIDKINVNYARDYKIYTDLYLIIHGFNKLGKDCQN